LALFTRSSLVGVATLGSLYLGLEIHGIPQAFAAATAAQIGIMVVLAIASRAVPHRDPPRNQSSGPTRPVPIPTAHERSRAQRRHLPLELEMPK
jgi:hypothetical protein